MNVQRINENYTQIIVDAHEEDVLYKALELYKLENPRLQRPVRMFWELATAPQPDASEIVK